MRTKGVRLVPLLVIASIATSTGAAAREPVGLHSALDQLTRQRKFSGSVVIRGSDGVRFARGYGMADPFAGRPFTPDTPADSASLAKPVTSAAVLLLVRDGDIELDAPVQRYLPLFPHASTTVRHLLSHSAGLALRESEESLANKSNASLVANAGTPLFPPGTAFNYCNLCSITLALLIERVAGVHFLEFVKDRVGVPRAVTLRPQRLADWTGRAIGYRPVPGGQIERFDSWEGEVFYGPGNFSISTAQLAEWGSEWWQSRLTPIHEMATTPARISGKGSGLALGNWYCARGGRRCHYLGHHEGFHHMLYWDADRRVSVAMMSNNTLAPGLQQRLQRALVAFVEGRPQAGRRELGAPLSETQVPLGRFKLASGEIVDINVRDKRASVRRAGIDYPAYLIGSHISYVPGLDVYLAGGPRDGLRWLSLYEDMQGRRKSERK